MAGFDNKISNILGTALPDWLLNQLKTRSHEGIKLERNNANLQYLANKTAWVRLVSSVNLDAREDMQYFSNLTGYPLTNPDSLAKDYILQGGTSLYNNSSKDQPSYTLRQGFKETYSMLGNNEVNKFGYRPMPGLTRVSIETQGKLGSIRMATIEFKVWDKDQLDIIDALYFKLGFTMYLEWGHTYYYKTSATGNNELQPTELFSLDPFQNGLVKEKIQLHIGQNRRDSEGNYDGMLGMVVNFSFSYNQEGGFDCTLKLAGLGTLAEGIKTNQPSLLPDILKAQINSLNSIYQKVQAIEQAKIQAAADAANKAAELEAQKKIEDARAKLKTYKDYLFAFQEEKYPQHKAANKTLWSDFFRAYATPPGDISTNSTTGMDFNAWDKYDYVDKEGSRLFLSRFGLILNANRINLDVLGGGITFNTSYIQSKLSGLNFTGTEIIKSIDEFNSMQYGALYFASGNNFISSKKKFAGPTPHTIEIYVTLPKKTSSGSPLNWADDNKSSVINNILSYLTENKTDRITNVKYSLSLDKLWMPSQRLVNNHYSAGTYLATREEASYNVLETPVFNLSITGIYQSPGVQSVSTKVNEGGKEVTKQSIVATTIDIKFEIQINDSAFIQDINTTAALEVTKEFYDYQLALNAKNAPPQADTQANVAATKPAETASTTQTEPASITQSALECVLRAIQLYSLVEAIKAAGDTLDIGLVPRTVDLSGDISRNQIFSCGIFKDFIGNLIDDKIDENNDIQRFAKYGFNASLLANRASINEVPKVNYKELLTSYVVPYKVNQDVNEGTQVTHPVYIQFGLLLMILNDICLLYDRKKESTGDNKTTPIMYVDFNPETNFCLSNPSQLSVDGLSFLIPFEGTFQDYVKLFDPAVLNSNNEIIGTKENKTPTKLFDPSSTADIFLNKLPKFKYGGIDGDTTDAHRGKIMKVLINIDYLFNIIKQFLSHDSTNSVYLKSLLDQILSDMNKTLGNFNAFRVYYDDAANALQIVDDQSVPGLAGETSMNKEGRTDLPLYGASSIAKTLELKTDLSTKVNNMLAISANADWKKQASNSTDASPIGAINNFYYDRYINNRTEKQDTKISVNDTQINSAIKFNKNVQEFYGTYNPSPTNVNHATNYFIERMSKNKNESFPTRAAAMIPVSLGFTTDGISGFGITQGFTIPEQLLPYTYSTRALKVDKDGKAELDSSHKVGFITTGISHVIENNQWTTSIKGSMMYLKNRQDFNGALNTSKELGGIAQYNPDNPTEPDSDTTIPSNAVIANYPNTTSEFQNVTFTNIGIGDPAGDVQKINRALLQDVSTAAVAAGVHVSITTAVSGHTSTPSRHNAGQAVDIAIIEGKAVSVSNRADADKLVEKLKNMGYVFNSESGNPRAVLSFGFPKHDNHVHVSNKEA